MISNDYFVRKFDAKEWHLVKNCISAEDATVSVAKEGVIFANQGINCYFFDGLKTGCRYIVIQVKYVYIVVKAYYGDEILASFTDKVSAENYIKKILDERHIEIRERILDDPRNLDCGISQTAA